MPAKKGIAVDSKQISFVVISLCVIGLTGFLIVMLVGRMMENRDKPAVLPGQKGNVIQQGLRFDEYSSPVKAQADAREAAGRSEESGNAARLAGFKAVTAAVVKKEIPKTAVSSRNTAAGLTGTGQEQLPVRPAEKAKLKESALSSKEPQREKQSGKQKAKPGKTYSIQVGAFKNRQSVESMEKSLRKLGLEYKVAPGELTRVTVIVRGSQKDAADALKTLKDAGIHGVMAPQ